MNEVKRILQVLRAKATVLGDKTMTGHELAHLIDEVERMVDSATEESLTDASGAGRGGCV